MKIKTFYPEPDKRGKERKTCYFESKHNKKWGYQISVWENNSVDGRLWRNSIKSVDIWFRYDKGEDTLYHEMELEYIPPAVLEELAKSVRQIIKKEGLQCY